MEFLDDGLVNCPDCGAHFDLRGLPVRKGNGTADAHALGSHGKHWRPLTPQMSTLLVSVKPNLMVDDEGHFWTWTNGAWKWVPDMDEV